MNSKKSSKIGRFRAVFAGFLVLIMTLIGVSGTLIGSGEAYAAESNNTPVSAENAENNEQNTDADAVDTDTATETQNAENGTENSEASNKRESGDNCKSSLGALGWLVCPTTGKIAEAVDWLYEKIEDILVIQPIAAEDGQPIYEIWKYCLGITNIVFVIFLLVVIYSQLTGVGISNYGIKKALPKLIIAAVMVNLSFLICMLAVDVSNIVGSSLRGLFTSIEETAMAGSSIEAGTVSSANMYTAIAGGSALTIGGAVIAFEAGAIWMLIPVVLGAIVAVATGLITIALRQAVVVLLVMIAPLAMVAYMLPNTDKWFNKWKDLFIKMLVFYPVFSLLFGASSLAGFAIIMSSSSGFGVLLGVAVQIFPLFFSWKLMQMSGTVLGTINTKMQGLTARPLAAGRNLATAQKLAAKQKHLASGRPITPSLRLMQFASDYKIGRDARMAENEETIKNRGLARHAFSHYKKDGSISKAGERESERQRRNLRYKQVIEMDANNYNRGLAGFDSEYKKTIAGMRKDFNRSSGVFAGGVSGNTLESRLKNLDNEAVKASDDLKTEVARGAEIEYQNAKGFFDRVINAKFADDDHRAIVEGNRRHQLHAGILANPENLERYEQMKKIMEGKDDGVQTVLADAASTMSAQAQVRRNKFQSAAELTPATQNVADHISELVTSSNANENIDAIIGGLRVLNMRGDTDMVAKELEHNLVGVLSDKGNIELGTYASQAVANYAMFEVKDNDPVLRRFGKYINMQTAALYNDNDPENRRTRKDVSWWEYINSGYVEHDENGDVAYDGDGNVIVRKTRGMRELMTGTTYSRVERTAYKSQREGVRAASYEIGPDGNLSSEFSSERYFNNMDNLYDATLANIIGDQFSYLSGSEQITALARDITGVGKNGKWDWKYIFGDDLKNPTLEQKAEYIIRSRNLMKKFLGGHVPSQIARSKTDMLQAIESQYALFDEVMHMDGDGKEVVDLERLAELESRDFVDGDENTPGSHKNFLKEKRDAVKKRFQESFKEDAVKGFAKQFMKGYQGEAKDLLIKLLDPEALYNYYYPNGERGRRSRRREQIDDEDDGMPVGSDLDGQGANSGIYNDTRGRIQEVFDKYRGPDRLNVEDCWGEVSSVLESSVEMGDLRVALNEFAEGLSQYTDVSQLYVDIMRTFFGSD